MLGPFIVVEHGKTSGTLGTEPSGNTRIVGVAFNPFDDTVFDIDFDRAPDRTHAANAVYRFFHNGFSPYRRIQTLAWPTRLVNRYNLKYAKS
jgi:hypothetical protein